MNIEDAIACLKANGYKVSKSRVVERKTVEVELNIFGRPRQFVGRKMGYKPTNAHLFKPYSDAFRRQAFYRDTNDWQYMR